MYGVEEINKWHRVQLRPVSMHIQAISRACYHSSVCEQVLRDVFNYRPKLTKEQFLSTGFAERKVLLTRDVLLFCQAKNAELVARVTTESTRKR